MGGSVHVESTLEVGSRFFVTLQLKTIDKEIFDFVNNKPFEQAEKNKIME